LAWQLAAKVHGSIIAEKSVYGTNAVQLTGSSPSGLHKGGTWGAEARLVSTPLQILLATRDTGKFLLGNLRSTVRAQGGSSSCKMTS